MALFAGNLLPASFRGAPFAVLGVETIGGRRVALHQYPGRDEPWAEDMGRDARRFRFRGFIVDNDVIFAGGPIQLQRTLLIAAMEASGPASLTHPTLGLLQCAVTRFSIGEDLGGSRMSTVDVEFVESGTQQFPTSLLSASKLLSSSSALVTSLAADGVRLIALGAAKGGTRRDLTTTTAMWSSKAAELGVDATSLQRLAAQLPGNFGRFAAGGNAGMSGSTATGYSSATTIADLIGAASAARANITIAAYALADAAGSADLGYAVNVPDSVVSTVQSLADACADPADAIRLLVDLFQYDPDRPEAASDIGVATSGMVRRAIAAVLTVTAGNYQPSSADDAAAMIARLSAVLDQEATAAADNGDDGSYRALRDARGAIVADLRNRGATLAQIKTFRLRGSIPALALAQRIYRDASRAEQLVMQAMPVNPLFMPAQFEALAA
jgi:prophage DNA circulation protein